MNIIEYGTSWLIEDQLNAELLNEIKDFFENHLEFLYKDKKGYSTTGSHAEQYWIEKKGEKQFYYSNQEYQNIEQQFRKEIYERLKKASLLRKDEIELKQNTAWTVIGEEGSYHTVHTHSDSRIDGIVTVLYLNVPDCESVDTSNSIFLVLHADPSSHFVSQSCSGVLHINPKVGKLLIFPNHIPHGTYPQTKGIRQTFNVDYLFQYKQKSQNNINYA